MKIHYSHCFVAFCVGLFVQIGSLCFSMAEERIGNEPFGIHNYQEFKGLLRTINHGSRVYQRWVNGDEILYYRGDAVALTEMLQLFSQYKGRMSREGEFTPMIPRVLLRPGPPIDVTTFDSERIHYNWNLHVVTGFGFNHVPTITVYLEDGKMEPESISIPRGVEALEVKDQKREFLANVEIPFPSRPSVKTESNRDEFTAYSRATDKLLFAAWGFGKYDLYDKEIVAVFNSLLDHSEDYVRQIAVSYLERSFPKSSVTPKGVAIDSIQSLVENDEDYARYRAMESRISKFLADAPRKNE